MSRLANAGCGGNRALTPSRLVNSAMRGLFIRAPFVLLSLLLPGPGKVPDEDAQRIFP